MALEHIDLSMKVLVVDDMASARALARNYLKLLGFTNIEEAENGRIALERLLKGGVGLVLSDWQMPDMEGIELIDTVRSHDALKDLPFIMLTAQTGHQQLVEAGITGVSGYLRKPYTVEMLEEEIAGVFQEIREAEQAANKN